MSFCLLIVTHKLPGGASDVVDEGSEHFFDVFSDGFFDVYSDVYFDCETP